MSLNTGNAILSNAITVDGSYNVGIGTSTPLGKLHVSSPTAVSAYIVSSGGDYDTNLYLGYGSVYTDTYIKRVVGNLSLGTSATDRLYISSGGNVGIGTTSPTEKLHINNSSGTGSFIRFQDTAGGGVYIGGRSENMELYAGNAERMRITSSGNVGIGTTSIPNALGVAMQIGTTSNFMGYVGNSYFLNNWYYDGSGNAKYITSSFASGIIQNSTGDINLFTAGTGTANSTFTPSTRLTILNNGNVGIANTNPDGRFVVSYPTSTTTSAYIDYGGSTYGWYLQAYGGGTYNRLSYIGNDHIWWTSGPTERMRIASSGAVSLGATGSVNGNIVNIISSGTTLYTSYFYSGTTPVGYIGNGTGLISAGSAADFGIRAENNMVFGISNVERMRITSGGYFKASNNGNYAAPTGTSHEFRNTNENWVLELINAHGSVPYGLHMYYSNAAPNSSSGSQWLWCEDTVNIKAAIYSNGTFASRTSTYGGFSDIKLKENIKPATSKLDDLLKVNVVNYNFIDDSNKEKQIGVIAQELEKIFPNMVFETDDYENIEIEEEDENGNIIKKIEKKKLETKTKSVKYSIFIPMLIKAIQELNQTIQNQQQQINSLINR